MNYKTLKSMTKRDINGKTYIRNAEFYLGTIDLGTSQHMNFYINTTQTIQIVSVSDTIVKFKILKISPFQNIEYEYENYMKSLMSSNSLYEDKIREQFNKEKGKTILEAERRLKNAGNDYYHLRNFSKQELINFVAEFKL